ncbi:MAG TPA: MarC family protein [Geobacteraceae bacterium]|jgi:multiple antibiotic resistance protein|nr:MarC family protein [Geobacteraceae bacterium]
MHWSQYVKIFTALLAILNPFGAIPVFLALTGNSSDAERKKLTRTVGISVAVILSASALVGERLLDFFGISIASFQVGGSILLFLMAVSMMQAEEAFSKGTPEEAAAAISREGIAVVPLAIPLLAGPGSISTIIVYTNLADSWTHRALIILCCVLAAFVTWLVLRTATRLGNFLGRIGLNVASRLMGLLLAAIAIELFAKGIIKLLPGLA